MCLPAVPLMIAGAALTATSQIAGGYATMQGDKFQAKVDKRNADMDRASAQDSLARGRELEKQQGVKTGQLIGSQRAAMADNGIEVDYGTGLALQQDTRAIGYQDQMTIHKNAEREAQGYEISAWNSLADASAKKAAGRAAMLKGIMDAGGTVLSAASQVRKMGAAP